MSTKLLLWQWNTSFLDVFFLILVPNAVKDVAFLRVCFLKYFVTLAVPDVGFAVSQPLPSGGFCNYQLSSENFCRLTCVPVLHRRKWRFEKEVVHICPSARLQRPKIFLLIHLAFWPRLLWLSRDSWVRLWPSGSITMLNFTRYAGELAAVWVLSVKPSCLAVSEGWPALQVGLHADGLSLIAFHGWTSFWAWRQDVRRAVRRRGPITVWDLSAGGRFSQPRGGVSSQWTLRGPLRLHLS